MSDFPSQRRALGHRSRRRHDGKRRKGGLRVSTCLPPLPWQSSRTLLTRLEPSTHPRLFTADRDLPEHTPYEGRYESSWARDRAGASRAASCFTRLPTWSFTIWEFSKSHPLFREA